MEQEFKPHEVKWTAEKVRRFWDYYAHNKACESNFFSWMVGDAIVELALKHSPLKGNVLDYGCGHGFLIGKLLKKGISCEGLEFSADSANKTREQFGHEKAFKGVVLAQNLPTPLEGEKYDFVFLIETLEHLLPEYLEGTLKEINRITKNGGLILITVPNDEVLDAQKMFCPECGCIFHSVQHVKSWQKDSLSSLMKKVGFDDVICKATRFKETGRFATIHHIVMFLAYSLMKKKKPHLVYIGRKTSLSK
jgi:SAM-dependent methyltransferase